MGCEKLLLVVVIISSRQVDSSLFSSKDSERLPSYNRCDEMCARFRKFDDTDAYKLNCDNITLDRGDEADCFASCDHCSTSIQSEACDSRETPMIIQCHSTWQLGKGACKGRCDYHRPKKKFAGYIIDCRDKSFFPSLWETRQCVNDCRGCPPGVCDYEDFKISCPPVDKFPSRPSPPPPEPEYAGSRCELRCDLERPPALAGSEYVLSCTEQFASDEQGSNLEQYVGCIKDCLTCPLDVCDEQFRPGFYTCPLAINKDEKLVKHYYASWTVIGLIAVSVVACIIGASFYGRVEDLDSLYTASKLEKSKTHTKVKEVDLKINEAKSDSVVTVDSEFAARTTNSVTNYVDK